MQHTPGRIKKLLTSKVMWLSLFLLVLIGFFAYLGYTSNKYSSDGAAAHIGAYHANS